MFADTPSQITSRTRNSAYGRRVWTTGLIFSAIAIAWLAYLVPHFARRSDAEPVDETDPASRFSDSMRILRRGTAPLLDQDLAPIESYEVSTPLTRRVAVADLHRLERVAAQRRRRVLVVLLLALMAVAGVYVAGLVPLWAVAIPGGLVFAFVVVARLSVRAMRRSMDARYETICSGSPEATVFLSRTGAAAAAAARTGGPSAPTVKPGALWDPVPITMPTYVSKPLAPRTVRTIDLSGPDVTATARNPIPVTADAPPAAAQPQPEQGRGDEMPEAATA
jgi:hypothetical protein